MSYLTVAKLRDHVETDLLDDALQRLIDDAEQSIVNKVGELTSETDFVNNSGGANRLFLKRMAASITTVVEELEEVPGTFTAMTLAEDDYQLVDHNQVVRLSDGTNPRARWGDRVTIVYIPKNDAPMRIGTTIDLVKLAIEFTGLDSERVGDWSSSQNDYQRKRNEILQRLVGFPFA
jgi:hypothetical protein